MVGAGAGLSGREAELASMPYEAYLRSPEWQARRRAALARAGHRCQVCNATAQLQVHHRTYERRGREEPGDLTVLCDGCHGRHHSAARRSRPAPRPEPARVGAPATWTYRSPPLRRGRLARLRQRARGWPWATAGLVVVALALLAAGLFGLLVPGPR